MFVTVQKPLGHCDLTKVYQSHLVLKQGSIESLARVGMSYYNHGQSVEVLFVA